MATLALVGAPSSAGAWWPGSEKAPAALRRAGLADALAPDVEVHDAGDVPTAVSRLTRAGRRHQNLDAVVATAAAVADAVDAACARHGRCLVLGGDCTVTFGVVAGAARRWPSLGLVYVDGHTDLNTPDTTRTGIMDSMGAAHVVGRGTPELLAVGPRRPLLPEERVVFYGYVPDELYDTEREWLESGSFVRVPFTDVDETAATAVRTAIEQRVDAYVLHFDVDVVEFVDFPIADVPNLYSGLTLDGALDAVRTLAASPKLAAITVTELNPDRDHAGTLVRAFAAKLANTLKACSIAWS
ncbi:MAG TPA: arginase family protein [Actinomycetota bacterium]|nr:arginase family protein [Actinomycetota bacterium]